MFSEFDEYLKLEFLPDYWSDEGAGIASAMLSKFSEQDWRNLVEQYYSRLHAWQIRCAEVLDSVNHPASKDILIGLLASESDDVVVAAADSLRSMGDATLTSESVERLKKLSVQGSAPVRAVLEIFLNRRGAA